MKNIVFTENVKIKLRSKGVACVYLFGSYAEGLANKQSDFDFGILLNDGTRVKPGRSVNDIYQNIYAILAPFCLEDIISGVIDIVFLQSGVSLELQANVVKYGEVLMDDDPSLRMDYEEQVMMRMADVRPILDQMDRVIMHRI